MNRFATRRIALAILAIGFGPGIASAGNGQPVPHKEKCAGAINVSEMISPTVAYQESTGEGNATHMGKYTQTLSHKADLATGEIFDGEFTSTAADGSTAYGVYFGSFALNPDGTVSYHVTAVWLGGSGRFGGLYGIADVVAEASGVSAGSSFHYSDEGVWYLP